MFTLCVVGFTAFIFIGGFALSAYFTRPATPTPIGNNSSADNPLSTPLSTPISTPLADPSSEQVVRAQIETDKGTITLDLLAAAAPKTVQNFTELAKSGYYDGLTFHRVIDGFMIQGGDPTGTGSGGESTFGGQVEDEINADALGLGDVLVKDASFLQGLYSPSQLQPYQDQTVKQYYEQLGYIYNANLTSVKMTPGVIAMANSGPNTNGSQFFIVTESDQPHLDGKHTVFGSVVEGLDIAQIIEQGDVMRKVTISPPAELTTNN